MIDRAMINRAIAAAVATWVAAVGCRGAPAPATEEPDPRPPFECNQRRAAYIATGGFAGAEVGVVMDCDDDGPRIRSWRLVDEARENTSEHSLHPDEFNEEWDKIEATGWRNLRDCDSAEPREGEPTYKIGVKDHALAVSMTCTGRTLPFPYNRVVDTLDVLAAKYSR